MISFDSISTGQTKEVVSSAISDMLNMSGIHVFRIDTDKPWGIELKIAHEDTKRFLSSFFSEGELPAAVLAAPFGGKILVIDPSHRLSWHVHERKDAFLKVVLGEALIFTSLTDVQSEFPSLHACKGELIHIPELVRHRIEGGPSGVIIAEISRNVFPEHPSDDADERRISDDYGRAIG